MFLGVSLHVEIPNFKKKVILLLLRCVMFFCIKIKRRILKDAVFTFGIFFKSCNFQLQVI